MKILCVSDQIDPLIYSVNIKERYQDVDLVISAGDLPMEYLEFIVSSLNKPLFFVFGNHNLSALPYYHKNLRAYASLQSIAENRTEGYGSTYLGFTTRREGGLLFAGVSGCIRYNSDIGQYTANEDAAARDGAAPYLQQVAVRAVFRCFCRSCDALRHP